MGDNDTKPVSKGNPLVGDRLSKSVPSRNFYGVSPPQTYDAQDYFIDPFDNSNAIATERSRSTPQTPNARLSSSLELPAQYNLGSQGRRHSDSSGHFNRFAKNYLLPAAKWAYSPIGSKRPRHSPLEEYHIEYSVFKLTFNYPPVDCDGQNEPSAFLHYWDKLLLSLSQWVDTEELKPMRIPKGSSGSYFIYGTNDTSSKVIVGVFKPKDEEPYGPLSPKWTKWLHRTFFPWFFGRSCLLSNIGYISEAAASVLDRQLHTGLVPRTDVIYLKSSAFFYSYWNRHANKRLLPPKIGSFQHFLNGYVDANSWFKLHPLPSALSQLPDDSDITLGTEDQVSDTSFKWSKSVLLQFREELEKLVVLDYIMRNTDRGPDNWMISITWLTVAETSTTRTLRPRLNIGAIDSGLAFPWKHPDEWRLFPFGWLFLPLALIGHPFSDTTRRHFLPLLTSTKWWESTVCKLKAVFQKDRNFKEKNWSQQLAVLKGQALNVVDVLRSPSEGPLELTRRNRILVWDDVMRIPVHVSNSVMENAIESSILDMSLPGKRRPTIGVIEEESPSDQKNMTETTALLHPASIEDRHAPTLESLVISGYDYNTNLMEDGFETNTKMVIIERIEPLKTKPPLFTYC